MKKIIEEMRAALANLEPPFDYQRDFIRFVDACIAHGLSYNKQLFTTTAQAQRQHEAWFTADPAGWLKLFPKAYNQANLILIEKGLKPLGPPRATAQEGKKNPAEGSSGNLDRGRKQNVPSARELFLAEPMVASLGKFESPLSPTARVAVTRHARKLALGLQDSEQAISANKHSANAVAKALEIESQNVLGLEEKLTVLDAELEISIDTRTLFALHSSNGQIVAALRAALSDILILKDLKISDYLLSAVTQSEELSEYSESQRMGILQAMEEHGTAFFSLLVQKVRNEILLRLLNRLSLEKDHWHYCNDVLNDCECKPSIFVERSLVQLDIEIAEVRKTLSKLKNSELQIPDFTYTLTGFTKIAAGNNVGALRRLISNLFPAKFSPSPTDISRGISIAEAQSKQIIVAHQKLDSEARPLRTELTKRRVEVEKLLKSIASFEATISKSEKAKEDSLSQLDALLKFTIETSHNGFTLSLYREFRKRNELLLDSILMFESEPEALLQESVEDLLGAVDAVLICESLREDGLTKCDTCNGALPGCHCISLEDKAFVLAEHYFGLTKDKLIARLGQYGSWVWGLSHLGEAGRLSRLIELAPWDKNHLELTLLRAYFAPLIKRHFEGRSQPDDLPKISIFKTLDSSASKYGAAEEHVHELLLKAADQLDPRGYFTTHLPEVYGQYLAKKSKALFDSLPQIIPDYSD